MKYKVILIQLLIILGLFASCLGLYNKTKSQKEEIDIAYSNLKAYIAEKDSLTNSNRVFKFTIEDLKYSQDSINKKLLEAQRQLKIKDKDLKYLEYQLSKASKRDTIIFRDTIFRDRVRIDTTIGDEWYNLNLKLSYPNKIISEPTFKSEKTVIGYLKKETIKPPRKFFLCRWFQRKHKVVEVIIEEKNPYIKNEKERYIEIIQ